MLGELCAEIRNYFTEPEDIHLGIFSIVDGALASYGSIEPDTQMDFLSEGQFFRIVGSVFNDGVYQYPATELHDEVFRGAVWPMRVPADIIALVQEIQNWKEKYMSVDSEAMSPYTSESFGGYSYTKSGASSEGQSGGISWVSAFNDRLGRYRKARVQ